MLLSIVCWLKEKADDEEMEEEDEMEEEMLEEVCGSHISTVFLFIKKINCVSVSLYFSVYVLHLYSCRDLYTSCTPSDIILGKVWLFCWVCYITAYAVILSCLVLLLSSLFKLVSDIFLIRHHKSFFCTYFYHWLTTWMLGVRRMWWWRAWCVDWAI